MFKYNDKVIVVKDEENDGFFIGLTGILKERTKNNKGVKYAIDFRDKDNYPQYFWIKEDEIQKI